MFQKHSQSHDSASPKQNYSPFANEEYTVGWICPLSTGLTAATGMLDKEHGFPQTPPGPRDPNTYTLGSIGNFNVVISALPLHEPGAFSAAIVAQAMLSSFPNIRLGLLVGTGAGVPCGEQNPQRDIRLGDVVIGSSSTSAGVVAYDYGKQNANGSFEEFAHRGYPSQRWRTGLQNMTASHFKRPSKISLYVENMLACYPYMLEMGFCRPPSHTDNLFQPHYHHQPGQTTCTNCDRSKLVERAPRKTEAPVIHYGTIASGNRVMKDPVERENIRQRYGAKCIEMEAAGLMNNFPCLVVRGISNYADSHKNDQWEPYAASTAAACAKEIIEHVQPRDIDDARSGRLVVQFKF